MHTRIFLSSDQKKIFLVIKAHEEVLLKEAEKKTLNKELELGNYLKNKTFFLFDAFVYISFDSL